MGGGSYEAELKHNNNSKQRAEEKQLIDSRVKRGMDTDHNQKKLFSV